MSVNDNDKSYLDIFNEYMKDNSAGEEAPREKRPNGGRGDYAESPSHEEAYVTYSFGGAAERQPSPRRRGSKQIGAGRKGLKWIIKRHINLVFAVLILAVLVVLTVIISVSCAASGGDTVQTATADQSSEEVTTSVVSYQIRNVNVLYQDDLLAGCETYACTMLLQYLGYDIDEFEFADNYLITAAVTYDENGTRYGPDMNSAFAGDIYTGFGINAPAMAKSMNKYLTTAGTRKAYDISGTSLEDICEEYILNDMPVMVWATESMAEPYIDRTWVVDYVDENATTQIGDTTGWYEHEHCMLLIGFDRNNYYFCDSLSGEVVSYEKTLSETRYAQLGSQSIVVK